MLVHSSVMPHTPERTVIVGGNSFVGKALAMRLEALSAPCLAVSRDDVDLAADEAGVRLAALLRPHDAVVLVAAKAPCRNVDDLLANARLLRTFVNALARQPVDHVVNISSDAVYGDERIPLEESIPPAPTSLHGVMHLGREIALAGLGMAMATVRPTLIYGASDPHNGYGPNQFRRLANSGSDIALFGAGEERRDHVDVSDVAELLARIVLHRSQGILNIATGSVQSFSEIAAEAIRLARPSSPVQVHSRPRIGPMPHNGYRPFDPAATYAAFPDFHFRSLAEGMSRAQQEEFGHG